ncbi:hypothetical protein ACLB2K_053207 [Fragaria x ananassa]
MASVNCTNELNKKGYHLQVDTNDNVTVCYLKNYSRNDGLWRTENPLINSLHVLVIQLVLILFLNHVLVFLLRPLRQPRIVADILAGVLLGPSAIGNIDVIRRTTLSFNSLLTLETIANLGLVYYMFLLGLELDFRPVIRSGKKALSIAVAGILVSVPVGWGLHYYVLRNQGHTDLKGDEQERLLKRGPLFWGISLATTNFADLARILADLKLLQSEIGRLALSAAVISDMFSGFLFMIAMAFVNFNWWLVGLTSVFIAVFIFVVRPALSWVLQNTTKKDSHNELHVCFILSWIVICGFITDACGAHSIVGAFMLGAIMPKELELKSFLVERIGNFVSSMMMPLFYLVVGLRFNVDRILYVRKKEPNGTTKFDVMVVVALAFTAKLVATSIAALINKIKLRDSLILGVLMNTKGLLALIILSSARDLKVLDQQMFAIMLIIVWGITIPVGPILAFTYKSSKRSPRFKHRNIESVGTKTSTDFRILACTHTVTNTSGMVDLIESSNPLEHSSIHLFAVNLVELTGHASAMLIVHDACKSSKHRNEAGPSNSASNAFEAYASQRENVFVQALTVVSAYDTMHEDICTLAEDKNANLVIIPFHRKSNIDDGMLEDLNPSFLSINKNVIENSPCTVCVFVDRGLAACRIFSNYDSGSISARGVRGHKVALLFLGGPDDREALAYALRMAGHSGIHLTVIRLTIPRTSTADSISLDENDKSFVEMAEIQRQKQLDNLYMDEFRLKTINNTAVRLFEDQVNSWEAIHNILRNMEGEYALCIVGRDHGRTLSFEETSIDNTDDSDELGDLGEVLVSSRFMTDTSILVIKQGAPLDERKMDNKMGHVEEQFGHTIWQPPAKKSTDNVIQTDHL